MRPPPGRAKRRHLTEAQDRQAQKRAASAWQRIVDTTVPDGVHISFDTSQEVAAALRALHGTGLFGNGGDCASVAEELLRRALLDPAILPYWQVPPRDNETDHFICRSCGHAHAVWAPRCKQCLSLEGLDPINNSAKKLRRTKRRRTA